MNFNLTRLHCLILLSFLLSTLVLAKDPTKPGAMERAIAHLEAAKNARQPLVCLLSARRAVVNAKANKGGERKQAVAAIDQAMEAAESGDMKTMNSKVSSAIYDLKQAMNNAK